METAVGTFMSSKKAIKLDIAKKECKTRLMRTPSQSSTATKIRRQIESGGERSWSVSDFEGLSFSAVAQTLSRMCRAGTLTRVGKGLYWRPRNSAFGPSSPHGLRHRIPRNRGVFPAGLSASNLLGFTTQNPAHPEVATNGSSIPSAFLADGTIVHTRRPSTWLGLTDNDAALLEFLRARGTTSELSPKATVRRLLELFREPGRIDRLAGIVMSEPPRVRAMLGAIAQELGQPKKCLAEIKAVLNPLTKFDFGLLSGLKHAKDWQAKGGEPNEPQ